MREVQRITATLRFELEFIGWPSGNALAWLVAAPSERRRCYLVSLERDDSDGDWYIRETLCDGILYKSTREMRTPDLDKLVDAVMADLVGSERRHA